MAECMKRKSTSVDPNSQVVECHKNTVTLEYDKKTSEFKDVHKDDEMKCTLAYVGSIIGKTESNMGCIKGGGYKLTQRQDCQS